MNESSSDLGRTRRTVLRGLTGALAAASFGQAFGKGAAQASATLDHASLLDLAATAEALMVTFYHQALSGAAFRVEEGPAEHLRAMLDAELHHLHLLESLGGRPLTRQFFLPGDVLTDAGAFVDTGLHLEATLTGAYVAATHQFAALGQPELAATAAQLGAGEAQHLTLLSGLAGLGPSDLALPTTPFRQVADATPALAPFLRGGSRTLGPLSLPAGEQIRALLGDRAAPRGQPFLQVGGQSPQRS